MFHAAHQHGLLAALLHAAPPMAAPAPTPAPAPAPAPAPSSTSAPASAPVSAPSASLDAVLFAALRLLDITLNLHPRSNALARGEDGSVPARVTCMGHSRRNEMTRIRKGHVNAHIASAQSVLRGNEFGVGSLPLSLPFPISFSTVLWGREAEN